MKTKDFLIVKSGQFRITKKSIISPGQSCQKVLSSAISDVTILFVVQEIKHGSFKPLIFDGFRVLAGAHERFQCWKFPDVRQLSILFNNWVRYTKFLDLQFMWQGKNIVLVLYSQASCSVDRYVFPLSLIYSSRNEYWICVQRFSGWFNTTTMFQEVFNWDN